MIRLVTRDPAWHDLAGVVRVLARPLDTPTWTMIEAAARSTLDGWRAEKESGGSTPVGVVDLEDTVQRGAIREAMIVNAVCVACIVDWDCVADGDGRPVEATPEAIADFVRGFPILATDLYRRLLVPWADLVTEKNASAPGPNGTSAPGPTTVAAVPNKDSLASTAGPDSTGSAAHTSNTSPALSTAGKPGM